LIAGDCGLPLIPLPFLNVFRSPRWFLVFLSWAACIQGMFPHFSHSHQNTAIVNTVIIYAGLCINGLVNVVITTIERRFGLQSTQTGLIAASYDIGEQKKLFFVVFKHFRQFLKGKLTRKTCVN
jgi:hypothetical protein